jgi:DNA helicase IV
VTDKSAELVSEQAHFDLAQRHLAKKLDGLADMSGAAANPAAAQHLKRFAEAEADALRSADAVAFGRIDLDDGERFYLGRRTINGDSDVLVVNWRAPGVAGYYQATHADRHGVERKRTFRCTGNTIEDFTDVLFAELATAVDRHLLAELARGRTGSMREIVATIQAAQYDVIRTPLDHLLVIEGGPGTGKTAVALHRVSWLLYQHGAGGQPGPHGADLRADDVLVVGPNPAFTRYIGTVLPELGDTEVVMRDITGLAPSVRRGRSEPADVARLKGDPRMARLLARALEARIGAPEPDERLLLDGRIVTLPGGEVAEVLGWARSVPAPYARRRHLLRERLMQLVFDRTGVAPARQGAVENLVERLWPQQTAAAFLRDLLGSQPRLRAAATDVLSTKEVAALHRRGADRLGEEIWSLADLPLLDEAEQLINGTVRQFAHIVVDEAQDLSPMQLRCVGRRSRTGSLTIVGDLAQSTGAWARDEWAAVTAHLPASQPVTVSPLRYGYRVPRQVYAHAQRLLPVAASLAAPPEVVRDGPGEPQVHRVDLAERAGRTVEVALTHAKAGRFVGVVCPTRRRREVEQALADNGVEWSSADRGELGAAVNLVTPQEAKGLEFDAVVVVEPEDIVAEDPRGHRLLYVALTRTTGHLDVVCVGDPLPLHVPERVDPDDSPRPPGGFTEADARRLAAHLADRLRASAPPDAWPAILARLREQLPAPPVGPSTVD